MDEQGQQVEKWSRHAHILSNSDPSLGTVLTKSLNLMTTVNNGGIDAPSLRYTMESMRRERELAMEMDPNKEAPLRYVIYSVSETLESMIKSLIAKDQETKLILEEQNTLHADASRHVEHVPTENTSTLLPKEEEIDFMMGEVKEEPLGFDGVDDNTVGRVDRDEQHLEAHDQEEDERKEQDNEGRRTSSRKRPRYEPDNDHEEDDKGTPKDGRKNTKNYKCKECPNAYDSPFRLANHVRTHTGERPFTCNQCDATFIRSQHHSAHLRKAHGSKPYQCHD